MANPAACRSGSSRRKAASRVLLAVDVCEERILLTVRPRLPLAREKLMWRMLRWLDEAMMILAQSVAMVTGSGPVMLRSLRRMTRLATAETAANNRYAVAKHGSQRRIQCY